MNDFPGSEDERMRRLLNDAVSDVEPRDSLDSIRSRTAVTQLRSRRPWILGAGAAVVATAATVAAVALMGGNAGTSSAQDPGFAGPTRAPASDEGSDMPNPEKSSPPATKKADPTPVVRISNDNESSAPSPENAAAPEERTVPVYYVGDTSRGPRLFREFHTVSFTNNDPVTPAVSAAMTDSADDHDYQSAWPSGTQARAVGGVNGGEVLTIDVGNAGKNLRTRPLGMSADEARLAIEQVIYTAQGVVQARPPVQFMLNGERTDTLLGVPTSEPVSEGDPTQVLAQVWIIAPAEGADVGAPFQVSGLAAAFEANVQWELLKGDVVVKRGFTTAEECCTMAPYSFKVSAPPGDYTLVVHDEDASGGAEGFQPWQDTKNITIVP